MEIEGTLPLIDDVKEKLSHNSYVEAVDLLLEAEKLIEITNLKELDESNYPKVCLYLIRTSTYEPDLEDTEMILIVKTLDYNIRLFLIYT